MEFSGKKFLVTGASQGIGRELVIELSKRGAEIAIVGRSIATLEQTCSLASDSKHIHICPGDLRKSAEVERIWQATQSALGGVDVLMNIAGVWHDHNRKYQGPRLFETAPEEIDEVIEVGLLGALRLSRLVIGHMVRKRSGKIVFVSCGFAGPHEASGWLHYYVTNKSIEALIGGLAAEMRPYDIQVNGIAPWFVASEAGVKFFPEQSATALKLSTVVDMLLFLASPASDHISGQIVELRSKADHS